MDEFFKVDPLQSGTKGIIFVGDMMLVCRRDDKTDHFPLKLDFPGGGSELNESPFDTFKREAMEEFGLKIKPSDIIYFRKYPSTLFPGKNTYFPVAKLPVTERNNVTFGGEGTEWLLMSVQEYLHNTDAVPFLAERTRDYLENVKNQKLLKAQ
ncbi:MAG TPA: NUDIX domain-containing protein [Candidatus Saccharimonadales bacterium]|nr:NUDIX domain-containing protein [Candidatus Saccharimonadales bacterium]